MEMYKCRALIRNIYRDDVYMRGDIVDSLATILEKFNISKINIDMPDFKATFEIDNQDNYNSIINEIDYTIKNYILSNTDRIDFKDSNELDEFISFVNNNMIFEHYLVGNMVSIIL